MAAVRAVQDAEEGEPRAAEGAQEGREIELVLEEHEVEPEVVPLVLSRSRRASPSTFRRALQ